MTGAYDSVLSKPFLGLQSHLTRRVVFSLYILIELAYLYWRVFFSLGGAPSVYAWALIGAEFYVIVSGFWFYYLLGPKMEHKEPPKLSRELTVDVFIATYNEEVDLVRTTAIATRDMDYPHRTWICDDGRRPEMKAMAESLGVGYITRPRNEHYKAGNLNNALSQTDGDLVMVLDADHIPRRSFLKRTIGYFEDPLVALVQTPQIYYNTGSYQHRTSVSKGLLWHEGRIFQHRIMAGAERAGCAFFIGTGGLLRRSALEEIGGFATGSVTEDIFTSMRLHAEGYHSVFVDEPLGFLQAPKSPHAYATQRLRWAQGGLQILRIENPLFKRGLTLFQRIAYLHSLSHAMAAFPNLLFYLVPALYILFYLNPINAAPEIVIPMIFAHLVVNLIVYRLLAAPDGRLLESSFFKFINLPILIRATFRLLFPKGLPFRVTPKGRQAKVPPILWLPAVVLTLFHTLAIAVALRRVFDGELTFVVASISMFFSGTFVVLGLYVLRRTFGIKVEDEVVYVPINSDTLVRHSGHVDWQLARLQCLGPSLAVVDGPIEAQVGDLVQLDLTAIGMWRPISGRVAKAYPASVRNRLTAEVQLVDLDKEEQEAINRFLFNTALPNFLGGFVDSQGSGPPPDPVLLHRREGKPPLAAFQPGATASTGRSRGRSGSLGPPSGSYYRVGPSPTPQGGQPAGPSPSAAGLRLDLMTTPPTQPKQAKPLSWVNPRSSRSRLVHHSSPIGRIKPDRAGPAWAYVRIPSWAAQSVVSEPITYADGQSQGEKTLAPPPALSLEIDDLLVDYLDSKDKSN
ncbi:MAG: glycosyltransferase [Bradymonadales bacterium]|nr:glycosyltransferase [Bradymonadales bacterium]